MELPLGLGSRHIAAANIGAVARAVGLLFSESSVVPLFCHGRLVGEIIPDTWMTDRTAQLQGPVEKEAFGDLTVLTPNSHRTSAGGDFFMPPFSDDEPKHLNLS